MDWIRAAKLGHGSFATVNLATSTGRNPDLPPLIALKSSQFSNSSSLMHEKFILDLLQDCPQIIRCYGDTVSIENGQKLYNVLLDYAAGGDLAAKVKTHGCLPESEARRYTKDLLRGLSYIHKVGFVHCDIKLQNILLAADGGVRIADFGLAARNCAVLGGELRGTPLYMSPEMVAGGEVGPAADIWALGCAVAELVAGKPVWWCSDDVVEVLMRIGVGDEVPEIPDGLSDGGKDFLRKCFVKDPSDRWTAEMLLNHPFMDGDDEKEETATISPRCPFDFPDWPVSSVSVSVSSLPSTGYSTEYSSLRNRMVELTNGRLPDWSVCDDWVTVR